MLGHTVRLGCPSMTPLHKLLFAFGCLAQLAMSFQQGNACQTLVQRRNTCETCVSQAQGGQLAPCPVPFVKAQQGLVSDSIG